MVVDLAATKYVISIAERLGILKTLKKLFLKDPDAAQQKLSAALAEIEKFFLAIDAEFVRLYSISALIPESGSIPQKINHEIANTLGDLSGPALKARMSASASSCAKITN